MAELTDKQRQALAQGRKKGIKRKPTANKCDTNNTYAAIFHFIESRTITESEWELLNKIGITKDEMLAAGITNERKLKKCVNVFLDDSPQMVRELMQRSEPVDPLLMHIDLTQLTADQLEKLANGDDPRTVIFSSAGGD